MPPEEKQKPRAWPVLRAYSKALWKYPGLVIAVFVTGLIAELGSVIAPLYLKELINLIADSDPATVAVASLVTILGFFAATIFFRWIASNVQGVISSTLDSRVMADLEKTAFNYLLGHSHDFFVSNFAGALTRRVNRYAGAFEQLFDTILFNFFGTAVFAIGAIVVLFQRDAFLGLALLLWMFVFLGIQLSLIRWKQPVRIARAAQDTRVTAVLSDAVSNQSTISQFAASSYEKSIFGQTMEKWRSVTLYAWLTDTWINGVLGFLNILLQLSLLSTAVFLWVNGTISVGDFLLIQIYVLALIERIWGVGRMMRRIYDSFADAHEMVVILEKPHGVQDVPNAAPLRVSQGAIEIEDIDFGFTEQGILKNYSLSVAPGEKVALVGPSGAGKSTVTKLLLRLYDVTSGTIRIDGQDISRVTQDSLRESIAFVPQEPILFHRTLMDNIKYGRRDATDEDVIEASKKARCHGFISALPLGYDTFVGERGIKLSGGERQRVAIARAILKNAPILILDEATSSLDSESESLIQEALAVLMGGKTVVVIAHRLSTIMHMDRIIVMEQGRIAAQGSHAELLDHKGSLYHKLWSIQAGSFIADTED